MKTYFASMAALALSLAFAACSPATLAKAEYGDRTLELSDARGEVTPVGNGVVYSLTGWYNPSCQTVDEELSVRVEITAPDPLIVPVGEAIDVTDPDAPISVFLGMGAFGGDCQVDCEDPQYSLTGTVTFTAIGLDYARGHVELELVGDIPFAWRTDPYAFAKDTRLHLRWDEFKIPSDIDHCE